MKVLDLFSGIGGFSVGLEKVGFETIAFCEIEPYCQAVLRKHWPDTPIYNDVKQLTGEQLRADGIVPSVIVGGYPCQPFSVAGRQRGEQDERHLWPEVHRLIREVRPRWVICENVSGHIKLGLDEVLATLEAEGYTVWPFIIPACGVDAPHKRDRVWIIAHANSEGQSDGTQYGQRVARASDVGDAEHDGSPAAEVGGKPEETSGRSSQGAVAAKQPERAGGRENDEAVANSSAQGLQGDVRQGQTGQEGQPEGHAPQRGGWPAEPDVGRVANGVPARSHRIKALGNAVVPQIPEIIGRTIMQFEGKGGL